MIKKRLSSSLTTLIKIFIVLHFIVMVGGSMLFSNIWIEQHTTFPWIPFSLIYLLFFLYAFSLKNIYIDDENLYYTNTGIWATKIPIQNIIAVSSWFVLFRPKTISIKFIDNSGKVNSIIFLPRSRSIFSTKESIEEELRSRIENNKTDSKN